MNLRLIFFDTEKKEWFKPSYKPLSDLFVTGNGDVYHVQQLQEHVQDSKTELKIVTAIYKVAQYVGTRDENQIKYYTGSLVDLGDRKIGTLTYTPDGLYLDYDGDIERVTEKQLKNGKVVGHIFEKKADAKD